jgi:hypothetical protein
MRNFVLFNLMALAMTQSCAAFDFALGFSRAEESVQDQAGKNTSDPFSPTISFGHSWRFFGLDTFSPRLGYTKNTRSSSDSYGGDYQMETLYVLYDFLRPTNSSGRSFYRYGVGSFTKKTQGSGGNVTVPNGTTTATAYRADAPTSSSTLSLDLGWDYKFANSGGTFKSQGFLLEFFLLQPLSKLKSTYLITLAYSFYL